MAPDDLMNAGRLRHRLLPLKEQLQPLSQESLTELQFWFKLPQFGQRAALQVRVDASREERHMRWPRVRTLEEGLERVVQGLLVMRDPVAEHLSMGFRVEEFLGQALYVVVTGA